MSFKGQCHQNANVTKTQISPLELTFVYLPNGSGKNRSPDLITINPNGLPGHGLSYSRLVLHSILSSTIWTVVYVGPQNCFIRTTDSFIKDHMWPWQNHPDGKLVLNALQWVLLTQMAKLPNSRLTGSPSLSKDMKNWKGLYICVDGWLFGSLDGTFGRD